MTYYFVFLGYLSLFHEELHLLFGFCIIFVIWVLYYFYYFGLVLVSLWTFTLI